MPYRTVTRKSLGCLGVATVTKVVKNQSALQLRLGELQKALNETRTVPGGKELDLGIGCWGVFALPVGTTLAYGALRQRVIRSREVRTISVLCRPPRQSWFGQGLASQSIREYRGHSKANFTVSINTSLTVFGDGSTRPPSWEYSTRSRSVAVLPPRLQYHDTSRNAGTFAQGCKGR
jgi:hypothetical protein